VGRSAEKHGRKPLLLLGFAALPVRAVLFALISNPLALIAVQLLDIITGAVMGVITAVVLADVTKGTGRFNLAQGMFGTVMGVGATLSPALTGLIVDHFGRSVGFLSLAGEGFVALVATPRNSFVTSFLVRSPAALPVRNRKGRERTSRAGHSPTAMIERQDVQRLVIVFRR